VGVRGGHRVDSISLKGQCAPPAPPSKTVAAPSKSQRLQPPRNTHPVDLRRRGRAPTRERRGAGARPQRADAGQALLGDYVTGVLYRGGRLGRAVVVSGVRGLGGGGG